MNPMDYSMETKGGTLLYRMEGTDLPAQMEVNLSELLAFAAGGNGGVKGRWKNKFQRVYPLSKVKEQTKGHRVMPGLGWQRRGMQLDSLLAIRNNV